MKVKAIRLGYYDNARRKEGNIFHIKSEEEFSKVWMEKVSDKKPTPTKKVKEVKTSDTEVI